MERFPKISIITPTLNQGKFIRQTIESVLSQNYPNLEYIVLDGGSTDDTIQILKSYGDAIHWVSEKDTGQADAINKGFRLASGEIVAYINSDDFYLANIFHKVADQFNRSGCRWLSGDYVIIDPCGKPIQPFVISYKKFLRTFSSRTLYSIVNYLIQPSTFWRRDFMFEFGLMDTTLHFALDYDFFYRAMLKEKPFIFSENLSAFRIHPNSKGTTSFETQFNQELVVMRRYCHNPFLIAAHTFHNELIKLAYRFYK